MNIRKFFAFAALMFVVMISYGMPVYADPIVTDVAAYILIDSKSGQVLFEKNADKKLFPASTTKILTAIVALENGDLNQLMTASIDAIDNIGDGGMNIGISEGEKIRMVDLLNALLIQSANDTANIIAENLTLSSGKSFIDLMNERAKQLGAVNTNFTNPSGMHDPQHCTTARDLSIMARYAMAIPEFREIVAKDSYLMPATNKHPTWDPLYTTNKFMYETSDFFTKPIGIKSGFTGEAGFNLVSSAVNKDGMELIAVVLGGGDLTQFRVVDDSKMIIERGYQEYSIQKLTETGKIIKNVTVTNAKDDPNISLVTKNELSCVLPNNIDDRKVAAVENVDRDIRAPVQKGDVLGYVEYERNGIKLGKVDLVADRSVEKKTSAFTVLLNILKIILIVFACFFAMRLTLRYVSRRINAKKRASS